MMEFLTANIGTIIVLAVLVLIVALIVRGIVSDKKKGKSSCGAKCGCCPNSALCHKTTDKH
ncbi:MAG: FeoB-associated Cys-rich membrane protein [Oscillospiraceae bacterium]|nr:FeoB-associated Cys-rich membrane protein [Oscillospiraceae bacterium]